MKNIAICDDDKSTHVKVENLLLSFYNKNDINIFHYYSGEELLDAPEVFGIIFMDIEMASLNGIETSKEIRKTDIDVFIIIISGFDDYKSKAYAIHAFDYLDKPIDEQQFIGVLKDIEKSSLIKRKDNFAFFQSSNKTLKIKIDDIYYFERCERKVKIHSVQGDFYTNELISEIAKKMELYDFTMPHRAFIVNFYHIIDFDKTEIILSNKDIVPISKLRLTEFKKLYNQYLGEIIEER